MYGKCVGFYQNILSSGWKTALDNGKTGTFPTVQNVSKILLCWTQ